MKDGEHKVRIKAADYVWCKDDECLVPRSKLNPSDSIFEDEDEGPTCPFCGGTQFVDVAKRSGDDRDKNESKDKPAKGEKNGEDKSEDSAGKSSLFA
jgi:hypothetical protein